MPLRPRFTRGAAMTAEPFEPLRRHMLAEIAASAAHVTAAPDLIPPPLLLQLKAGGRMVIPAGLPESQQLLLVEKDSSGRTRTKEILPVRFSQLEGSEPG